MYAYLSALSLNHLNFVFPFTQAEKHLKRYHFCVALCTNVTVSSFAIQIPPSSSPLIPVLPTLKPIVFTPVIQPRQIV